MSWYRAAADIGDRFAQWRLGEMLLDSDSGQSDYVQAYKWLRLAKEVGDSVYPGDWPKIRESMELAANNLSPSQLAEAESLCYSWLIAKTKGRSE